MRKDEYWWSSPDVINQMDRVHQTKLWEKMLQHFGLRNEIDDTPISLQGATENLGKLALLRPPIIQINAGHQLSG